MNGAPVTRGARGLADIVSVVLGRLRPVPSVAVLSDVANPLTDRRGAAVFGPQKGLVDPAEIAAVDKFLAALAALFGIDATLTGTGAAGGVGARLLAWGAWLTPGAAQVAELIGLADAIADADVVTGEGSYDRQSAAGKVPGYVAQLASMAGTTAHFAAGRIAVNTDTSPFAKSRSLTALAGSHEAAVAHPERWLRAVGAATARSWLAASRDGES